MLFQKEASLQTETYNGITNYKFWLFFHKFGPDTDTFIVPWSQFQETILVKIGAQSLKEVLHSLYTILMSMFGSPDSADFNAGKRRKSDAGQDRGCRRGDPISPLPGDECVLFCPWLALSSKNKTLNSRALVRQLH
ncbi:hypothetical protein AVEN_238064-1 [Araneus ventricosus]|uniref:Uncharacterized protein n=1 Tax=Araneus ventricosus TaxID=182803 RepID=A0A4Y2I083_ARAVE|nr:hypothetical protein AVEN_238064-1 [Araneus ventricosus]